MSAPHQGPDEPLVVHDGRLDPESGEVRPVLAGEFVDLPLEEVPDELLSDLAAVQAELTADLQRLTAEYSNYRKRVERDRLAVAELVTAGLLENLLPLLDSIELARQHGDLEGAFKGVGEGLEQIAERQGLERYGAKGDAFDPAVHHALVQAPPVAGSPVAMVAEVLQPGWRLKGGRILRPVGVAVAEPGASAEIVDVPAQES